MFAKKILKYIFALFLLIGAFTFYEISDISSKYINRSLITFDINNARNPQIKKMLRFFDNIYAYTLLSLSEKHKSHFNQEDLNNTSPNSEESGESHPSDQAKEDQGTEDGKDNGVSESSGSTSIFTWPY